MGASPQGGKLAGRKASMSALAKRAVIDSFAKLTPREQAKNPVMLMVYISAILTLGLFALSLFGIADAHPAFIFAVSAVLWLTVLFANFAEALAEGRGKAQADSLRAAKRDIDAHKLNEGLVAKGTHADDPAEFFRLNAEEVSSAVLKKKDLFYVAANEQIPADGEIVMGAASVDESAITGESAPVIREAGGDRSAVTGGTTVLSDWLVVRVTADAGHSFLDQMIAMVESAARKKTPNEIALEILLIALTIVFLVVSVSLFAFSRFGASQEGIANPTTIASLVALFVCLAPTTIGALLSAIGIAGMSRLNQANVLAMSGRAVEAAGDVDVLLLDKTGTITLGNRQAAEFIPVDGASEREVADAAQLASLTDETPEGRSIVVLAKELFDIRARVLEGSGMTTIPFTAQTRMSGVDFEGHEIRKGAADAVKSYVESCGGTYSAQCAAAVEHVSRAGGTPLLVARDHRILGVVYLKDIVKQGIKENFADLRTMGIKTVMITGDHASTARAIGRELDIFRPGDLVVTGAELDEMDDAALDEAARNTSVFARVSPLHKLRIVRALQHAGEVCAMTGDGVNDAPALKAADIGVAMGITGTDVAKDASDMILMDDRFTTIVYAVREGRRVFRNIQKVVSFLVADNVAQIVVLLTAVALNWNAPLTAVMILWVNLATASLPALALGVEPASRHIMEHPPMRVNNLLDGPLARRVIFQGVFIAALALVAFVIGQNAGSYELGCTMAFGVLGFSQVLRCLNQRSATDPVWDREGARNRQLGLAAAASIALMLVVLLVPPFIDAFGGTTMDLGQWALVVGFALLSVVQTEIAKAIGRWRARR